MTIILEGRKLACKREEKLKIEIKKLEIKPKLAVVLVGDDPASRIYVREKEKAAKRVGIEFEKKVFSARVEEMEVYQYINSINRDEKIHGIVVQLPLPAKFDPFWMVCKIDPLKDVDCLTPENLGSLMLGKPYFLPAVVKAVIEIIGNWKLEIGNSNVVIVGAGNLVGKPLAIHLKNLGATVILCDEYTKNLGEQTKKAEILVSATGQPNLIKGQMIKKGSVVIDAGAPRGDVDFAEGQKVASFITPVPGGVGPLTVVCLLENVLLATQRQVLLQ